MRLYCGTRIKVVAAADAGNPEARAALDAVNADKKSADAAYRQVVKPASARSKREYAPSEHRRRAAQNQTLAHQDLIDLVVERFSQLEPERRKVAFEKFVRRVSERLGTEETENRHDRISN